MPARYHRDIKFKASRISYIRVDGYYFPLKDISAVGFSANIKDHHLTVGDNVAIEVIIDDQYGSVKFDINTKITSSENNIVSGKWNLRNHPKEKTVINYFKNRYNMSNHNNADVAQG